ncbi:CBS domain-containing protein [Marinobacter sp.]|uniref:CBS domain-containing protein n=1 Tax=Marinobacter sp. TaxID=50741 RepID=UPI00384B193B
MQVKEVMTRRTHYVDADASIRETAELMAKNASGFEPVVRGERIIGTVTDRDIALRAVAESRNPDEKISSIVTDAVFYAYEDDDVQEIVRNMQVQQVQRLVVLNDAENKDLTGIITVGDIATRCEDGELAMELVRCTRHYH